MHGSHRAGLQHACCGSTGCSAPSGRARAHITVLAGASAEICAGPGGGAGRAVGRGQVDAAAHRRPARDARQRPRLRQRARLRAHGRRRAHARAPRRDGLRLPVPPAAAGVLRAGERRHSAAHPGGASGARPQRARASCCRRSGPCRARAIIGRPSCRAASSSAPRSPARSPTRRGCCSPTSRPATSIRRPPAHVFDELIALDRARRAWRP